MIENTSQLPHRNFYDYQKTLHHLAKCSWNSKVMLKEDGEICQVGLFRFFVEKFKGLFEGKIGINRCQRELVEHHLIHFLKMGEQNQWLTSNNISLIQSFVERLGFSPAFCKDSKSILQRAVEKENLDKENNKKELVTLIQNGNIEGVRILLKDRLKNIKVEDLEKCLFLAIEQENIEMVKLLIEAGADLNKIYDRGISPLFYAKTVSKRIYRAIAGLPIASRPLKYVKELCMYKKIAHMTDQWCYITIKNPDSRLVRFGLGGMIEDCYWKTIAKRSQTFGQECSVMPQEFCKMLVETAQFAADIDSHTVDDILLNWKEGKPLFLNVGNSEHHVGMLLWNNLLLISDRSDPSGKSKYQVYNFDPFCMTQEIISKIINTKIEPHNKADLWARVLEQIKISSSSITELLSSLSVASQKSFVGNCTWLNSEGLVLPLLILYIYENRCKQGPISNQELQEIIEEQKKRFIQWRSYQQAYVLQKFFKTYDKEKQLLPNDELIFRAFINSYPFQNLDELDPALAKKWKEIETFFVSHMSYSHMSSYYLEKYRNIVQLKKGIK